MAMSKGFRILEKSKPPQPHSILLEHRNKINSLLFESQAVAVLSTQETDLIRKNYTKVLDAYGSLGVLQYTSGENSILYLVLVTGCFSVGKIGDTEIFRITQTQFVSLQHQPLNEDKIGECRKLLNSGTFYFCFQTPTANGGLQFDITLCGQKRRRTRDTDNRFFWNRMLHIHLLRYGVDCDDWLLKAMCGSVEIRTVYAGSRQARTAIISRLSCERAGTRFNVRGSNDEGCVANFVETEQAIYLDNEITSYVQTRGSVPLYWEQPGVQVGSHKVKLSRSFEASIPVFERHMQQMKQRYGEQTIVNLLGTSMIGSKEGEAMLSNEFQRHHRESKHHSDVGHIVFDFHQECRSGQSAALQKLKTRMADSMERFGLFHSRDEVVLREQRGTIRTNCLDCLDRTNSVQTFLGLEMVSEQIGLLGIQRQQVSARFEEIFKQMWINNGNEVSKIYAGTGAIQGGSKLIDGARSAARTIQNNLLDNSKQEAIDILLLGSTLNSELADRARILLPLNMLHAPTPVLREMCKRYPEFVTPKPIYVVVGTYNVNGGKHFRSVVYKDVSLTDWLLDSHHGSLIIHDNAPYPVDVFAVGFQEIVDLNASNIMAASSDNAKQWADELQRTIGRDGQYYLLTYQQLVGVCLFIYVKQSHLPYVRDLATDSVKTGLGGATGNKGATAIRFVLYGTSICFVCAHFAAGQSQVAERNADYAEITRKIAFPMGRSLKSHDYVFWCGDFNYRIDMDKEQLREQLRDGDLTEALSKDQLTVQRDLGLVFTDFMEGGIDFLPTYKYDLFSDDYDTSEKCRAPAWTDRILWRRRQPTIDCDRSPGWMTGRLLHYGRTELKQSDHRPVMAIFEVDIGHIDQRNRELVFQNVIKDLGPPDGTIVCHARDTPQLGDDSVEIYDEQITTALLQELTQIGEVILVRYIGETMWITFRDGQSALAAVQKESIVVCGLRVWFELKTPDWLRLVEREIAICTTNTVSLSDNYNCLGIPKTPARPKDPPKPSIGPPQRPPQPTKSTVGIISISSDLLQKFGVGDGLAGPPPPTQPAPIHSIDNSPIDEQGSYVTEQNARIGDGLVATATAIYEEISDDINIPAPRDPPPPPPPTQFNNLDETPSTPSRLGSKQPIGQPPPLPVRRSAPPPVPQRSGAPPPLPTRPNN